MNREILFRGKRVDSGEWVEGFYNRCEARLSSTEEHFKNNPRSWIQTVDDEGFAGKLIQVDPATIGEYTGLTDRNGKRIWDGDILLFTNTDNEQSLYDVRWDYHRWLVQMHGDYSVMPDDLDECFCRYAEVICNIYDNPELLGGAE